MDGMYGLSSAFGKKAESECQNILVSGFRNRTVCTAGGRLLFLAENGLWHMVFVAPACLGLFLCGCDYGALHRVSGCGCVVLRDMGFHDQYVCSGRQPDSAAEMVIDRKSVV